MSASQTAILRPQRVRVPRRRACTNVRECDLQPPRGVPFNDRFRAPISFRFISVGGALSRLLIVRERRSKLWVARGRGETHAPSVSSAALRHTSLFGFRTGVDVA